MTAPDLPGLLLTGIAALLDTAGVATYRSDGTVYAPGEIPVTFGDLPPDGPAVALTITDDERVDPWTRRFYVQARIRATGDPLDLALYTGVDEALSWQRHPAMPDPLHVVQIAPGGFARLGRVAGAWHYSRNFSVLT